MGSWVVVEKNEISVSVCLADSHGNRESASTFGISIPFLYFMSYWYVASINAHIWTLDADKLGILLRGLSKIMIGLWSVSKVN